MMSLSWNGERPADFRRWEEAIREEIADPVSVTLEVAGAGEWRVSQALVGDSTSIRKEAREALRSAGLPIAD
jgi:hypothetical protein